MKPSILEFASAAGGSECKSRCFGTHRCLQSHRSIVRSVARTTSPKVLVLLITGDHLTQVALKLKLMEMSTQYNLR